MSHPLLASTRALSDTELLQRMDELAARERNATAHVIAHLAEVDSRGLHLKAGYASLFEYCRVALCFSEHEAYNRSAAAGAARRFPVVLDMLMDGAVNLTTVRLLAGHLTDENHCRVLESARGKRKTEVEEIVAALAARRDAPTAVRKLPAGGFHAAGPPVAVLSFTGGSAPAAPASAPEGTLPRPQPARTSSLAPDRYQLQVTVNGVTLEKWRLATDMVGHAVPGGDGATVLDRALTAFLVELTRKKFCATKRPRPYSAQDETRSRHIPAEVKRVVWVRDLGRCAFVGSSGHRCGERRFLEFHHVTPYAAGGRATVDNIQLRCRPHNQYEARAYFGTLDRNGADDVREARARYRPTRSGTGRYSLRSETHGSTREARRAGT
jgi:hypothetical protein